jgi:hypothetical protein
MEVAEAVDAAAWADEDGPGCRLVHAMYRPSWQAISDAGHK